MKKDYNRSDRVADVVMRVLASTIREEMRDPRLQFVNINDVEVSRDLSVCKVFVTVIGSDFEEDGEEAAEALNKAASFLRSKVANALDIRSTPTLKFFYDRTAVAGQRLSKVIDDALEKDATIKSRSSEE